MAYKRNPIRSERMCALARKLITDSWNGPLNAATQWLERSLDDSSNRRLVLHRRLPLTADAAARPGGATSPVAFQVKRESRSRHPGGVASCRSWQQRTC